MNKFSIFKNVIYCENISSTNDYAKQLIKENTIKENCVVFTENQLKGRGRYSHRWYSEKNKSLTFSFVLFLNLDLNKIKYLESIVLKTIIIALNKKGVKAVIKRPNDIYFEGRKIGGVLLENTSYNNVVKHSIIGIGLNINNTKYPYWVPKPISVMEILGKEINIEIFFTDFCLLFEEQIKSFFIQN